MVQLCHGVGLQGVGIEMLRLFLRLFRIKDFEPCKSCEVLKAELQFARAEKLELLNALINITKPNVVIPSQETKVLTQVQATTGTFSRRRAILEEQHKVKGDVIKTSTHLARPDSEPEEKKPGPQHISPQSVDALEQELGLVDEEGKIAG